MIILNISKVICKYLNENILQEELKIIMRNISISSFDEALVEFLQLFIDIYENCIKTLKKKVFKN